MVDFRRFWGYFAYFWGYFAYFWAFLTDKKGDLFPTRIELIFDLMANKQDDDRERLRTLFYFQNQIKQIQNRKTRK